MDNDLAAEIHRRALMFCVDNHSVRHLLPHIEAAMTIGAYIVMEQATNESQAEAELLCRDDNVLRGLFPEIIS
jgi:hypothetical protein